MSTSVRDRINVSDADIESMQASLQSTRGEPGPMDAWQREDFVAALQEERAYSARLACECEEMAARLNRTEEHLEAIAKFAAGLAPDPWPEPSASTAKRRKAGAT